MGIHPGPDASPWQGSTRTFTPRNNFKQRPIVPGRKPTGFRIEPRTQELRHGLDTHNAHLIAINTLSLIVSNTIIIAASENE